MLKIGFLIFSFILLVTVNSQHRERCGFRRRGICKVLWFCPEALEMLRHRRTPELCGFYRDDPVVCCYNRRNNEHPHYEHDNEPLKFPSAVAQEKCQNYEEKVCGLDRPFYVSVVGGTTVKPKELPFMGLVGYGDINDIEWDCGCSLISDKYVLSAAHCTRHPISGFATWVRLGELDLSSTTDEANPSDFRIINRINHPRYNARLVYNDIALYELDSKVEFTLSVQPICLPTRDSYINAGIVVGAGWGTTDIIGPRSTKLLKVDLNHYPLEQCSETASGSTQVPNGLDDRTMMCAGVLEGGKDTCSGDSGGPLFLPRDESKPSCNLLTQLGITSFGKQCAMKGLPGVYTKILNFIPWIESIVWSKNQTAPGVRWNS